MGVLTSRGRVWEPSHGLDSKVRKAYVFDRSGDGIFDCGKGSVSLTVRQSFSKLRHGSLHAGDQRTRKVDKCVKTTKCQNSMYQIG